LGGASGCRALLLVVEVEQDGAGDGHGAAGGGADDATGFQALGERLIILYLLVVGATVLQPLLDVAVLLAGGDQAPATREGGQSADHHAADSQVAFEPACFGQGEWLGLRFGRIGLGLHHRLGGGPRLRFGWIGLRLDHWFRFCGLDLCLQLLDAHLGVGRVHRLAIQISVVVCDRIFVLPQRFVAPGHAVQVDRGRPQFVGLLEEWQGVLVVALVVEPLTHFVGFHRGLALPAGVQHSGSVVLPPLFLAHLATCFRCGGFALLSGILSGASQRGHRVDEDDDQEGQRGQVKTGHVSSSDTFGVEKNV